MKARQFVNVVMRRYGMGSSLYAVSRIKPEEQLFYPSTKEAQASSTGEMETISISRMPAPNLRLELSVSKEDKRLDFLPFYERGSGGYSKILCVDAQGRTVLYDADAGLLHSMPCLSGPKGPNPVSFSILDREPRDPGRADALYVMGRCCDYFNSERVSELDNLWFGIGARWPYDLCAMDLYSLGAGAEAPGLAYS